MDPISEKAVTKDFMLNQHEFDIATENIVGNIGRDCTLETLNETELVDYEDGQRAFVVGEYKDENNTDRTWICLVKKSESNFSIYSSNNASEFFKIRGIEDKIKLPMLVEVLRYGLAIQSIKDKQHCVIMPDLSILTRVEYVEYIENLGDN
jgi:hypothetical protein